MDVAGPDLRLVGLRCVWFGTVCHSPCNSVSWSCSIGVVLCARWLLVLCCVFFLLVILLLVSRSGWAVVGVS